jgi:hypothetical protein
MVDPLSAASLLFFLLLFRHHHMETRIRKEDRGLSVFFLRTTDYLLEACPI